MLPFGYPPAELEAMAEFLEQLIDRGIHQLKGIPRPWQLYRSVSDVRTGAR